MNDIIARLLASEEPSIRYKVRVNILQEHLSEAEKLQLYQEIKTSFRVRKLLSEVDTDGRIPRHPYEKWRGAHWVLYALAELEYPAVEEELVPLRNQVYEWLFSPEREKTLIIDGRVRKCASIESNALYSTLKLGIADERARKLAARLVEWQWPDGGWNCDRHPEVSISSFMESLLPLQALAFYAKSTGCAEAGTAAGRAGEIFLKRHLYKRLRDGQMMDLDFTLLHYPCYWHYDILFGLKVLAEAGFIDDPRCSDALDLLEEKRLTDGGFPAEKKYYQSSPAAKTGCSLVTWGGTSKRQLNEFVTADALWVLKQAHRF